jgi:hypothetical protein
MTDMPEGTIGTPCLRSPEACCAKSARVRRVSVPMPLLRVAGVRQSGRRDALSDTIPMLTARQAARNFASGLVVR